jgi:hypothetical protein
VAGILLTLIVYFTFLILNENLNKLINKNKKLNLNEFYKKYNEFYPNNKQPNKNFLE